MAAGIEIEVEKDLIPIYEESRVLCKAFGLNPLGVIASGALLITASPPETKKILERAHQHGVTMARIGRVKAVGPPSVIMGTSKGYEPMLKKVRIAEVELNKADFEGNAMDAWHGNVHVTPEETMGAGVFEGRSGHFIFEYGHDEVVYVLSGRYRLEDLSKGHTITAGPGDLVVIPKGIRLRATVIEPFRCLYVTAPAWADWISAET